MLTYKRWMLEMIIYFRGYVKSHFKLFSFSSLMWSGSSIHPFRNILKDKANSWEGSRKEEASFDSKDGFEIFREAQV